MLQKNKHISYSPSVTMLFRLLMREKHIERVIPGFLTMTYPNLVEILVADGGSTDKTWEIASKISQSDTRIRLFVLSFFTFVALLIMCCTLFSGYD